jgi:hypothetical protein
MITCLSNDTRECLQSTVEKIRDMKREVKFNTLLSTENQVGQLGALNGEYALLSFNVCEKSF